MGEREALGQGNNGGGKDGCIDSAIQRLKTIFGTVLEWTNFNKIIPHFGSKLIVNKSLISSNFVASLELAKNGFIEVKQNETFGNIYVRSKQ